MKLSKTILAAGVASLMGLGLVTENANAVAMATFSIDGGTPISVTPSGTGMFALNTVSGAFNVFLNGSVSPFFDLNGGAITATGPGSVTLCLSNDFTNLTSVTTAIGGTGEATAGSSIKETIFENGTILGTIPSVGAFDGFNLDGPTPFGGGPVTFSTFASATQTIMDCITITFTGPGNITFDTGVHPGVPDGGMTVALLGIALLAIAGAAKLRGKLTA
jgi:hypothetical protein